MTVKWYKHLPLFDHFGHIDVDSSLYLFPIPSSTKEWSYFSDDSVLLWSNKFGASTTPGRGHHQHYNMGEAHTASWKVPKSGLCVQR